MSTTNQAPNIHPKTGIHYGVIHLSSVSDRFWDEVACNGDCRAFEDMKLRLIDSIDSALEDHIFQSLDEDVFQDIKSQLYDFHIERASELSDLSDHYIKTEEFEAEITETEIIVLWSKTTKKANLCSPCFPNAGDLDDCENGTHETYCLPSWATREDSGP